MENKANEDFVKATRNKIRKYNDKFKAKTENKLFIENPQKFYRSIGSKQIEIKQPQTNKNSKLFENPI